MNEGVSYIVTRIVAFLEKKMDSAKQSPTLRSLSLWSKGGSRMSKKQIEIKLGKKGTERITRIEKRESHEKADFCRGIVEKEPTWGGEAQINTCSFSQD